MLFTGNERGCPASENDYISDDRAPSSVQAPAMIHDCGNQQDVRIECPQTYASQALQAWSTSIIIIILLTLLQDYYYYKLYEWGVFVPTVVSFSSYHVLMCKLCTMSLPRVSPIYNYPMIWAINHKLPK